MYFYERNQRIDGWTGADRMEQDVRIVDNISENCHNGLIRELIIRA